MTSTNDRAALTYARRSVWHIVEVGPLLGAVVGEFYMFKCYRWARAGKDLAIARGRPTDRKDVCVRCEALAGGPPGSLATAVPREDLIETA